MNDVKINSPRALSNLLKDHRIRVKKGWGQNFLWQQFIVERIIKAANINEQDTVVEIGAGLGILTRALGNGAGKVIALEIDRGLLPILQQMVRGYDNVQLVEGDVRRIELDHLVDRYQPGALSYKVVANLPYYLTSTVLTRLWGGANRVSLAVLMLQKEVADRLLAVPGTKEYGALSIFVQFFTKVEKVTRVPLDAFYPRPKVESAVVRLTSRLCPPVKVDDQDFFFKVVRSAFGKRRKTILNALSTGLPGFDKNMVAVTLRELKLNPARRGETFDINEFAVLSNYLLKIKTN